MLEIFQREAKQKFLNTNSLKREMCIRDSHRSHLSVVGFTELLPSGAGRVMEKELVSLDRAIKGVERPSIFVLGGAKVDDSLRVAAVSYTHLDVYKRQQ